MKKILTIILVLISLGANAQLDFFFAQNKAKGSSNTLRDAVVLALEMDETTTPTLVDETGINTGTIETGVLINQAGNPTAAHTFDGYPAVHDAVNDNDVLSSAGTLQISTWFTVTNLTATRYLCAKNSEYRITINSDGAIAIRVYNDATTTYAQYSSPAGSVVINTNYHLVVNVLDAITGSLPADEICEIWLNGVKLTMSPFSRLTIGMANTTNPLITGAQIGSSGFLGSISQFWMFDRILTSDEIAYLYNSGNGVLYDNLPMSSLPPAEQTFLASADYYVSSSTGLDTNDGLTPETAWQTLAKVDAVTIPAGNVVGLKAGDSWYEDLYINNSGTVGNPILYGAYGTGAKPIIYGSTPITGWTLHTGSIYKATVASAVSQLFMDGTKVQIARMPKTGYYYPTTINSTTEFTSTSLDAGINYVGSSCMYRGNAFTFSQPTVTASVSQTITLSAAPSGGISTSEGFIMLNHVDLITQAGEWAYDTGTNTVYAWLSDSSDPSTKTMTGSTQTDAVSLVHSSYVDIENLDIRNASNAGVLINNVTYSSVKNCDFSNNGAYGIYVGGGTQSNLAIENNNISNSGSVGIYSSSASTTISNNTIRDIGMFTEMKADKQIYGTGINGRGNNGIITYNTVDNVGYNGLEFYGENVTVSYNYVDSATMILDDGGGIYSYLGTLGDIGSQNSVVSYNIVLNAYGNRVGSGSSYDAGSGIYMDGYSHDVNIHHNTVKGATTGIIINYTNTGNTVDNNTVVDAGLLLSIDGTVGSTVTNNIVYATNKLYDYTWWTNSTQRLVRVTNDLNTFSNNKYVHHYSTTNLFNDAPSYVDFPTWQTNVGDAGSTFDNTALGVGEAEELFYNETKVAKEFVLTGTYRNLAGVAVTSPLILQPFTSQILIKE